MASAYAEANAVAVALALALLAEQPLALPAEEVSGAK